MGKIENMISLDKYKKALGSRAENMTDEEIELSRKLLDQLADVLFDVWIEKKNNQLKTRCS